MKKYFLILFTLLLLASCKNQTVNNEYVNEINKWHSDRVERLKAKNGWLNLAGLYWLKQGENKFGSDKSNDIIFPDKAPKFIGSFFLRDSVVTIKLNKNVDALIDSNLIKEATLINDNHNNTTRMDLGSLNWFVIKRADKYGIRLRDYESKLLKEFNGIERFPVDEAWKIKAKYIPFEEDYFIEIPNVIGQIEKVKANGKVVFSIDGKEQTLIPSSEGKHLFFVFADLTSGKSTYGAGRFLYTEAPDSLGNLILDFNKAYNPPCSFTKYATCPLPPKENYLKVAIEAGEKFSGHH